MMSKRNIRLFSLVLLLLSAACSKDEESIFTELSVRLVMPDSRPVVQLEISPESSWFQDINTYEKIAFPAVEDNRAIVRLRKGVYTLRVEAVAVYEDGSVLTLRNNDHNQIMQAVTWVKDAESIVLLLNR